MSQQTHVIHTSLLLGVLLLLTSSLHSIAQTDTRIVLHSEAKAGTTIRLQTATIDEVTIEGARKGDFFGEYIKETDDAPIILTGSISQLECYGDQITAIELVSAPKLIVLNCKDNKISSLDLTACPILARLDASNNNLSKVAFLEENKLEFLYLQQNRLTQLTLPSSPFLQRLECGSNQLTKLDIALCPKLQDLYCQKNQLTQISIENNKALWGIQLFGNQIQGKAMTAFIESLPQGSASVPMLYIVDTKDASEQNKCLMADVDKAHERGWAVYDHFGGAEINGQIGTPYKGFDYVPEKAEKALTLQTQRAKGATIVLDLTKSGDKDLVIEGVAEAGPYEGKQTYTLTDQTIVIRGALAKMDCSKNELTAILPQRLETLTEFTCEGNLLHTIDLSGATALKTLRCQNNQLKSINLTGCTSLIRVDCWNNLLRASGASDFVATLRDGGSDGPIIFLFDSELPAGLKDGNTFLKSDIANLKAKGWTVKDYINGGYWGMGKSYEGEDPTYYSITISPSEHGTITIQGVSNLESVLYGSIVDLIVTPDKGYKLSSLTAGDVDITKSRQVEVLGNVTIEAVFEKGEVPLPAEYFSFTRAEQGVVTFKISASDPLTEAPSVVGAEVTAWKNGQMIVRMTADTVRVYADISELVIPYAQLTSLDVSHLPHLSLLNCMLNSLETIDLSASSELKTLSCDMNRLSTLDLSANSKLTYVNCYGNQIMGSQMTAMMRQLPSRSAQSPGLLILIDSTYPTEANRAELEDVQLAIDKHWSVKDLNGDPNAMKDYTAIESIQEDRYHIYPNPTADYLYITGTTPLDVINLYTLEGDQLLRIVSDGDRSIRLDITNIPDGVYYLQIAQHTYPIVITH